MNLIVINLPERKKRLENIRKQFGHFEIQDGIRHPMPHTGCGLAHISAVRKGLQNEEYCVVIEDDCTLHVSIRKFWEHIQLALQSALIHYPQFHAIVFSPNFLFQNELKIVEVGTCFQISPTLNLVNTHCVLWSRNALKILEEYEQALHKNVFFPIDRLLFNDNWDPQIIDTWEKCLDITGNAPNAPKIGWNIPNTLIYAEPIVSQNFGFMSDHTGDHRQDIFTLLKDQITYKSSFLRNTTKLNFRVHQ